MKNKEKISPFDSMMAELMGDVGSDEMLEESMSLDAARVEKVPLRYRIIALGFLKRSSLDDLNKQLRENNCATLYPRSLWEASLIYAFLHGMSYKEWKKLRDICADFRNEQDVSDRFFTGKSIAVKELKHYIEANSTDEEGALMTRHLTRLVEEKIRGTIGGEEGFRAFLYNNIEAFSPVREKSRYYFCKYLYYMLLTRIDDYAAAVDTGLAADDVMDEIMLLFKGVTPLKRKKHTGREAADFLLGVDISPGGIFDAFNKFYFDYVSTDWLEALIDDYGSVDNIPASDRHAVAEHLRKYDPVRYGEMSDDEALSALKSEEERKEAELDEAYSLDNEGKGGAQRSRVGENTIRKYIKGSLDIDRMTLICFLLYFGSNAELRDEDRITPARLTDILLECGYTALREEDDFDYFVIQFLEAKDPIDLLMEEVTYHARREENFYLYRVYKGSYSYEGVFSG